MSISVIDQLQPADNRQYSLYVPYYQGNKRNVLPLAISLYMRGNLEGARKIEGGENIPFVATWNVSTIPADLTNCRMQFDTKGEQLSYVVTMANFEFIDFLIDMIVNYKRSEKNSRLVDFSTAFYRKLLRRDE
ncbi:type IV pilus biogenesis protein EbsA [Microcoleus sp. FACHB-672]|uniref:type IV pilus biogenesis protein EbsA n=1 Tax=Microcoleus sp. FACHB-672 TaxID=2692825 RepID=UPI001687C15F|nr:type IV pilus biogenesis protein EbsA [Microcoleus sp. FACHB-672]MBD2039147.1 hypothetical protein [Microcoleus sp. FACHB-672]